MQTKSAYVNEFVLALSRYDTNSPHHDKIFDEYAESDESIDLEIETRTQTRLFELLLEAPVPYSVILTGNAGDGKTRMCRTVVEKFVTDFEWNSPLKFKNGDKELIIIKDLSELSDSGAQRILRELDAELADESSNRHFLIAANEGKLHQNLLQAGLDSLHKAVKSQLERNEKTSIPRLKVFNLMRITSSTYLERMLQKVTDTSVWLPCEGCPVRNECIIRYNGVKICEKRPRRQLIYLYEILDHLDHHLTLRDTLIHLAHIITGGLTCDKVQELVSEDRFLDISRKAYYENCWGTSLSDEQRRKMTAVEALEPFRVGEHSMFQIDEFIVGGPLHREEVMRQRFEQFSRPAPDLGQAEFARSRDRYLWGKYQDAKESKEQSRVFLDYWIPHCRRKVFFEWPNEQAMAHELIPFLSIQAYFEVLKRPRSQRGKDLLKLFVVGLNRAFTGFYLEPERPSVLYLTSSFVTSTLKSAPIIRHKYYDQDIKWRVENVNDDDVDRIIDELSLVVGEHSLRMDLLLFEYVYRIAKGGHPATLATECALRLRDFKQRLLTGDKEHVTDDIVEFLAYREGRYSSRELFLGGLVE